MKCNVQENTNLTELLLEKHEPELWWPWAIFLVDPYNYTMPLFLLSIQRFVTVSEMRVLMPVHLLGIYSFPLKHSVPIKMGKSLCKNNSDQNQVIEIHSKILLISCEILFPSEILSRTMAWNDWVRTYGWQFCQ